MSWLLIPVWAALVYALFTLLRIRVNPWTIGAAVFAGFLVIGVLVTVMSQAQPYAGRLRVVAPTAAIVPAVGGRVVEVSVQPGSSVKAGDVLFRIDPTVSELVAAQRKASLVGAEAQAATVGATLEAARDEAAKAAMRAQADVAAAYVARLRAELAAAEYDLAQTVVRAPTAGTVAGVAVQTGTTVVAANTVPAVTILQDTAAERRVEARFRLSDAHRIRVGDEAEVTFDAMPGRVFKAKVKAIAPATAADAPRERRRAAGRSVVSFELVDDGTGYPLAAGATGAAAIYTDQGQSVAIVRRILLRMTSWLSYVCS